MKKALQLFCRSPLKTCLTLLLLVAAAFLFLYNLSEYSVSDKEYREARDKYEGVLTVDVSEIKDNATTYDYFLLSDKTNPANSDGVYRYEDHHQKSLGQDLLEELSTLPHISRVEKRYLTSGVSTQYMRLDTEQKFFPYYARCIVTATVKYRYFSSIHQTPAVVKYEPEVEAYEFVTLEDVKLLAGDQAWLKGYEQHTLNLRIIKDEFSRDVKNRDFDYNNIRQDMFVTENYVYSKDAEVLQPGRRVLLILRNNCVDQIVAPQEEFDGVYPSGYVHRFDVGDDSLVGWWPYFTDITDLPENWLEQDEFADLRELIEVTNNDVHTFDVVYVDDMSAQRRVAEGRMVCEEGRFIAPADAGQPVCVVNGEFLKAYGLSVGDTITLNLGNYLSEQYAPLGAVAVTRGRQSTAYTTQTFTIIGTWRDLNEGAFVFRDRYWCWSNNAIFAPTAFLPDCVNAVGHEFKPSEVSFVVGNAEEIIPFMEECLPILDRMGLNYLFSDGGWSAIAQDLIQARSVSLVKLLVFGGAAVFAVVLTVWLFISRKKREYAIYRALGMPIRAASMQLYVPFLLLGVISTLAGTIAARIFSLRQLAVTSSETASIHLPIGTSLYILGGLGFLVVLAAFAWTGILIIRRKSILELLRADRGRQKRLMQELKPVAQPAQEPGVLSISQDLGGSRNRRWGGRYLRRLLGRNLGRSALSLMLAALLAFAFGLVTVLRGIYAEAYRNVEVKPVITGGLNYDRAVKIADSGFVRDPYYEYVAQDGMIEMDFATIILTNRLDKQVTAPVDWLEGWDETSAMNTEEKVTVMYASHAAAFNIGLGDKVRLNEVDWWNHVSAFGMQQLEPGETEMDRRDKLRPFFQVVGIIQSDAESRTVFIPAAARYKVSFLVPDLCLDIAEYTLLDYHQATAFADYVKGQLDRNQTEVKFTMDTSYADRIYKIHRLIESLYPLAIAAALLLGGVLPGLIVLHGSREISILRALGVRAGDCVILYTLSQALCALAGLVLGIAMVLVALRPELGEVIVPFAIYLAAHLAACALGSGVFAWLCARKRVLEQLQAKE